MGEDATARRSGPVTPPRGAGDAAEDLALLRRIAAGDEAAMAALYDRLAPRVGTLVLQLVGDADEAADVVEETFWQAWRTAVRYDARRGSVANWLLITARSRALDRLRSKRRHAEWSAAPGTLAALTNGAGRGAATPDARSVEAETSEAIRLAMQELSADQRQVIEMAFLEGLTHSQIAARTEQPLGTVKTRIRSAIRKLGVRLAFLRAREG